MWKKGCFISLTFLTMFGSTLGHSPLLYFHVSLLFYSVAFGIKQNKAFISPERVEMLQH